MNINHKIISTALAALAAGTAMVATSTAVGAHGPQRWDVCPVADTVPLCEIVGPPKNPGADGSDVAHLPAANGTAVWTGDAKDHAGYGPVNPADAGDGLDVPDFGCVVWPWHPFIFCPLWHDLGANPR